MPLYDLLYVYENFITGAVKASNWLFTPIDLGVGTFSPIAVFGFGFLITYTAIAIVKWVIS